MQPINLKERRAPFGRFVLLYLLSAVLIVVGIIAGTRFPFRKNEELMKIAQEEKKSRVFQQEFVRQADVIAGLLDSVNTPGAQAAVIQGRIDNEIGRLTAMTGNADSNDQAMGRHLASAYSSLSQTKATIRSNYSAGNDAAKTMQEMNQLKADKSRLEMENLNLRNMLQQRQGGQ